MRQRGGVKILCARYLAIPPISGTAESPTHMAIFQNENRCHLMGKLNGTSMNNTLHSGDTSWTLPAEAHTHRFAGSVALPLFKSKKYLQTLEYGVNIYHRSSLTP
jgi:hypothetical protein